MQGIGVSALEVAAFRPRQVVRGPLCATKCCKLPSCVLLFCMWPAYSKVQTLLCRSFTDASVAGKICWERLGFPRIAEDQLITALIRSNVIFECVLSQYLHAVKSKSAPTQELRKNMASTLTGTPLPRCCWQAQQTKLAFGVHKPHSRRCAAPAACSGEATRADAESRRRDLLIGMGGALLATSIPLEARADGGTVPASLGPPADHLHC